MNSIAFYRDKYCTKCTNKDCQKSNIEILTCAISRIKKVEFEEEIKNE